MRTPHAVAHGFDIPLIHRVAARRQTPAYGVGRVRDVRQGPDGYIYAAVEHRGRTGRVVRLGSVPRQ